MGTGPSYRILQIAFAGSLAVHTLLLARWPGWAPREPAGAKPQRLTVAAMETQPTPPPALTAAGATLRAERPEAWMPPTGAERQVNIIKRAQRPLLSPEIPSVRLPEQRAQRPPVPAVVDLSNLSVELEQDPAYAEYFHTIRERIRRYAQRNFPQDSHGGEVFLYFILSSSGHLQSVEIDLQRSATDTFLHHASRQSIEQAGPFPPFPPSFQRTSITFRIIIDYEVN